MNTLKNIPSLDVAKFLCALLILFYHYNSVQTDYCTIHPPIPQSKALELQKKADILLFLEDVDGPDAKVARLSFSTKLTDYLSTGKCILAIGNKETAPMEYLSKNHAAIVAESLHEVEQRLHDILENPTTMQQTAQKAAKLAIENHHPDKIKSLFYTTLNHVLQS